MEASSRPHHVVATHSSWRKHSVLAGLAERFPGLAGTQPPSRTVLQNWLQREGAPWLLVNPSQSKHGYEATVANGQIPTRSGAWHDVFNVLAFLAFPRAKLALHTRVLTLQHERRSTARGVRSREEDALTLLDEAVLIIAGHADGMARLHDARQSGHLAAIGAVVLEEDLIVMCFGHALFEHLVFDRPPIGAGVLPLVVPDGNTSVLASVDQALANAIAEGRFDRPRFGPPLPWPNDDVQNWIRRKRPI